MCKKSRMECNYNDKQDVDQIRDGLMTLKCFTQFKYNTLKIKEN